MSVAHAGTQDVWQLHVLLTLRRIASAAWEASASGGHGAGGGGATGSSALGSQERAAGSLAETLAVIGEGMAREAKRQILRILEATIVTSKPVAQPFGAEKD
ncbi:hypothetical protein PybrP1_008641 [[Pythium] brassicae (nom. inval.)]|nr:hypothetical protein PybrP1_008641 [[Pythium] brassicae (nom. inval.)]